MAYDNDLIAGKLRRWEKYLERYRLPAWEEIPDFGLYMEQVVHLLKQYLSYLPPELKQSLSLSMLQTLLPGDLPEDEVKRAYTAYALRHRLCAQYFVDQVKLSAAAMLEPDMVTELAVQDTTELIASAAILSGLSRLFAEKLLLLKDKTLETGGSIEIIE